jgi:hypothetical protein
VSRSERAADRTFQAFPFQHLQEGRGDVARVFLPGLVLLDRRCQDEPQLASLGKMRTARYLLGSEARGQVGRIAPYGPERVRKKLASADFAESGLTAARAGGLV